MNRTELQQLAEERVHDAEALLDAGRWSGAYYLAGYAAECGLKACIARLTSQDDFPDKDFAVKSYTHKIEGLVKLAGVQDRRDADATANAALGAHWGIVKDRDEKSRYRLWTEFQARKLFEAVSHPANGVLPWIMGHW